MSKDIVYTADDEEPNCAHCDNFESEYDCLSQCGPQKGWYGYARTDE